MTVPLVISLCLKITENQSIIPVVFLLISEEGQQWQSAICVWNCLCNRLWTLVYQPHGYISPSCSTCPFIATVSRMTLQKFFRDVPLSLLWCQISFRWRGKGDERASGWVAFSWRLSHKYWGVRLSIGVCTTHCAGVLCVLSVELGMAHDFQNKAKPVCVSHKELPLACNWRLTRSYVVAEICWRFNSRELCISVMLVWSSLWHPCTGFCCMFQFLFCLIKSISLLHWNIQRYQICTVM